MIKVKKCPFCGGNAHVCEQAVEDENQFYIECERCKVECCHATTRETAALRWNCRSAETFGWTEIHAQLTDAGVDDIRARALAAQYSGHVKECKPIGAKFSLNSVQIRWIMDYIRNAYEAAWRDVRESRPHRGFDIERETGKALVEILEKVADK